MNKSVKKNRNIFVPAKKTELAEKDAKLTSQFADHRISYHGEETAKLKLEIIRDNGLMAEKIA